MNDEYYDSFYPFVDYINQISNIKPEKDGTGDESTLAKRRSNDLDFIDLSDKIDKSGMEEVKTLNSNEPTLLDFKDFKYHSCSLMIVFPCCNPC